MNDKLYIDTIVNIHFLPKVLVILPAFIPSTQINVVTPLSDLHLLNNINLWIELETTVKNKHIDWCDIVILCRNTEPANAKWLPRLILQKKPFIYDIDDNFFDIEDTILTEYYKSPERTQMLTEYIKLASCIRVYSEPMREKAFLLNSNTEKMFAPVDFRHILPPKKREKTDIQIVYATSRFNDQLSEIFVPALQQILAEYKENVSVHFLGFTPKALNKHPLVISIPIRWNYIKYLQAFSSAGYDIGLAPLKNDVFHRSKTNNKFREYGASQIAGIYSNVDVYSSCIQNGETGLLVQNTTTDWYVAIKTLIDSPEQRERIKKNAYMFVKKNYSQEEFSKTWAIQIKQIISIDAKYENSDSFSLEKTKENISYSLQNTIKDKTRKAIFLLQHTGIRDFTNWFSRGLQHHFYNFVSLKKQKINILLHNIFRTINFSLLSIQLRIFFTKIKRRFIK